MNNRKYLDASEIKKLLDFLKKQSKEPDEAFSTTQSTYYKMWAIVGIMSMSGLRTKEVRMLKVKDVKLGRKPSILVRMSKNGESRHVPIPNRLKNLLKTYQKFLGIDDQHLSDRYLFTTKRTGNPYSHVTLHSTFKLMCVRSGIGSEHSLHGLRHSFGFALYAGSKDLRLCQDLLGHRSISSTTIYTAVDPNTMRRTINRIF